MASYEKLIKKAFEELGSIKSSLREMASSLSQLANSQAFIIEQNKKIIDLLQAVCVAVNVPINKSGKGGREPDEGAEADAAGQPGGEAGCPVSGPGDPSCG